MYPAMKMDINVEVIRLRRCLLNIISIPNIAAKLPKKHNKKGKTMSLNANENSCALFAKISIGLNIKTMNETIAETKEEINSFSFVVYLSIFIFFLSICNVPLKNILS